MFFGKTKKFKTLNLTLLQTTLMSKLWVKISHR